MAHALRPSAGSAHRIAGDLRSIKWSTRREERYRILSSHRAGLAAPEAPSAGESDERRAEEAGQQEAAERRDDDSAHWLLREIQVFDIVHEEGEKPSVQVVFFNTFSELHILDDCVFVFTTLWGLNSRV